MTAPLMSAAASEASHSMSFAMDSDLTHFVKSAPGISLRFFGVSIMLVRTMLAVMPDFLPSAATFLTSATRAALDTAYAAKFGDGSTAKRDPMATMRPRPAAVMGRSAARMAQHAVRR